MPVGDTTFFLRDPFPALCVNNWRGRKNLELCTTPWTISTKSKVLNYLMVRVRQTNHSFLTTITSFGGCNGQIRGKTSLRNHPHGDYGPCLNDGPFTLLEGWQVFYPDTPIYAKVKRSFVDVLHQSTLFSLRALIKDASKYLG